MKRYHYIAARNSYSKMCIEVELMQHVLVWLNGRRIGHRNFIYFQLHSKSLTRLRFQACYLKKFGKFLSVLIDK